MEFFYFKEKQELNNFIAGQESSEFLQSWEWGELQKETGNKILRIGGRQGEKIIAAATLVKKQFFCLCYFYCPRGPVFCPMGEAERKEKAFLLSEEISRIAGEEGAAFLRFEPLFDFSFALPGRLKCSLVKTADIQPAKTLILDLGRKEEELLAAMHPKTRYNIKLAEKKGVKIREGAEKDFSSFWQMLKQTSQRDGFRLHERNYYRLMLNKFFRSSFSPAELAIKLFLAEYEKKPIAAGLFSFFGDQVIYLHGSSASQNRHLMAPYLLQWQLIKEAKNRGFRFYDFYGIDPVKWPGVTRFKQGFGGQTKIYPGAFDLVFNNWQYKFYKLARKLRRAIF